MAFYQNLPWHAGEEKIHELTHVPHNDNPTNPSLTPRAAQQLQRFPLIALGVNDPSNGQVWCTLWGGEPPISQQVARGGIIGIKLGVDATFDPVVNVLFGNRDDGELIKQEPGNGHMISALSIGLEERSRVKLFGRMIAGALSANSRTPADASLTDSAEQVGKTGSAQLVVHITQSLGNCPKYLNRKSISAYPDAKPRLLSNSVNLSSEARAVIDQADLFFISSTGPEDMDTNHRGGPPGFLRILPAGPDPDLPSVMVWPEYSGNNLYQTLGNLLLKPQAGIVVPNFNTGDVLYITGTAEILIDDAAAAAIAKTKLAVRFTVTASRLVQSGLLFRGTNTPDPSEGRSPYNPRIRLLTSEQPPVLPTGLPPDEYKHRTAPDVTAKLIRKTQLTPTITKFRFSLSDPDAYGPWTSGQYVALDFSSDLYMGYSHMRDDDPHSLNDDFLRTFTVASPPRKLGLHGEEFELVVRSVGNVTRWLATQREGQVEVGVRGFAGEFRFRDSRRGAFIAAGIGITPLLGQADVRDLTLFWSVGVADVGLVEDVLKSIEIKNAVVFLTGDETVLDSGTREKLRRVLEQTEIRIERRRITKDDLLAVEGETDDWYLCTAPTMRKQIQEWLPEKSIEFENFDY